MKLLGHEFGRKQFKNPMPRSLAWKIGLTSAICGYAGFYFQTAEWCPDIVQHFVTGACTFIVGLINSIAPFFGVETTKKKVDIEDVGSMEDKK